MISLKIQIRFGDCDLAGHVHNAAYLHYFESARINFFVSELGKDWDWKRNGLILKKNIIDYNIPTQLADKIEVEVRTTQIGTKSFTLSYTVRIQNESRYLSGENKEGLEKAYGESVIVCFDYEKGETIPIPEKLKEVLQNHLETK
ncbi:acyl-CoA thioesterase [Crocinitomix catalasitica]|nr:acyl-CoA thioesterase [Crocinitomix catalasitica]